MEKVVFLLIFIILKGSQDRSVSIPMGRGQDGRGSIPDG
jgi:hypothetical protein